MTWSQRGEQSSASRAQGADARCSYAVVPAIEREKALQARAQGMAWLEEFGRGFDRNDPSTFKAECLPADKKGGMIHSFGVQHGELSNLPRGMTRH